MSDENTGRPLNRMPGGRRGSPSPDWNTAPTTAAEKAQRLKNLEDREYLADGRKAPDLKTLTKVLTVEELREIGPEIRSRTLARMKVERGERIKNYNPAPLDVPERYRNG